MIKKYYKLNLKRIELKYVFYSLSDVSKDVHRSLLKILRKNGISVKIKASDKYIECFENDVLSFVLFEKEHTTKVKIFKYLAEYLRFKYSTSDIILRSADGFYYSKELSLKHTQFLQTVSQTKILSYKHVKQSFLQHEHKIKTILSQSLKNLDIAYRYFLNAKIDDNMHLSLNDYSNIDKMRNDFVIKQFGENIDYDFIEIKDDCFYRINSKMGMHLENKRTFHFNSDIHTQFPLPFLFEYEHFYYEAYTATLNESCNENIIILSDDEILTRNKVFSNPILNFNCYSIFKKCFAERCYSIFAITNTQIKKAKYDNYKTLKKKVLDAFFDFVFLNEHSDHLRYITENVQIDSLKRLICYVKLMTAIKTHFKACELDQKNILVSLQNRIY